LIVRGERVGFGPLTRELAAAHQRWFNDLRVTRTLSWPYRPLTREAAATFLDAAFPFQGDDVSFAIYELATLRPVGAVSLNHVDRHHGTADFALVIGEPDAWGRGYGTEATRLTLAYAFDVLGLYNVHLVVYANNSRGIRAYERAGFKRIGVRRGAHKLGRRRYDEIHMDAVADDFPPSHLHALLHPDEG
jgi:RimJ/RimL family protein N-acetyltransferase